MVFLSPNQVHQLSAHAPTHAHAHAHAHALPPTTLLQLIHCAPCAFSRSRKKSTHAK